MPASGRSSLRAGRAGGRRRWGRPEPGTARFRRANLGSARSPQTVRFSIKKGPWTAANRSPRCATEIEAQLGFLGARVARDHQLYRAEACLGDDIERGARSRRPRMVRSSTAGCGRSPQDSRTLCSAPEMGTGAPVPPALSRGHRGVRRGRADFVWGGLGGSCTRPGQVGPVRQTSHPLRLQH